MTGVFKFFCYSFIFFYSLLSTINVYAEDIVPEDNSYGVKENQSWTTAQNKRKKTHRKKYSARKPRRSGANRNTSASEKPGIKIGGGFVMGADGDTPLLFAGDYVHPWSGKKNFSFVAGANYWSYSALGESLKFMTIEGGMEYQHRLTPKGSLVAGARLTHVSLSGSFGSDSKMGFTILGGYEHKLATNAVGAEFRIPIVSRLDVNYLFFYYKFNL